MCSSELKKNKQNKNNYFKVQHNIPSNGILEKLHHSSVWLDLLAPVASLANGSQQLLVLLN